jgi:hypothetical protein
MSELQEWIVLSMHRFFIVLTSFILSSIYCAMSLGICRPQPMYYYLRDVWQETKFQRDPISLALIGFFILTICLLQFLIEMKKRHLQKSVTRALQTARDARINLEIAKNKLSQQNCTMARQVFENEIVVSPSPPEETIGPTSSNLNQITTTPEVDTEKTVSSSNTIKVARAVSLFGILPTIIFVILFSLDIGDLRPHGSAALSMVSFGIVVPSMLFARNSKMRKFASKLLNPWLNKFSSYKRQTKVEPIV